MRREGMTSAGTAATGALRDRLPNLIVIGAGKCGTSALHDYLAAHPDVGVSWYKELKFFGRPNAPERIETYAAKFPSGHAVRAESSPSYTMWPFQPDVPEQMAELLPEPRFVYIVGDPVRRVAAHWAEQYSLLRERRSFEEALVDLDDPANPYLCASRYGSQLERYLRLFPAERILVLDQRDLRDRRRQTLRRVFEFAGVDPAFDTPAFDAESNTAAEKLRLNALGVGLTRLGLMGDSPRSIFPYRKLWFVVGRRVERPAVEGALRARLIAALRDDVAHFRELTGLEFADWPV